mmetsp:Transcript_9133/g.22715  ORF Transcript_9133/g.22715 Transcript_9133/m.22715 type:complete len:271 (+) Transcript_9133:146-958(+)
MGVSTATTAPCSSTHTSCATSTLANIRILEPSESFGLHVCSRGGKGGSVRKQSSTRVVRSSVCEVEARWRTSRADRMSCSTPFWSTMGSALSRSSESSASESASEVPRGTLVGAEQCGSAVCVRGEAKSFDASSRKVAEEAMKARTCSGRRTWRRAVEPEVSPSGRHSSPCCLSITQPWYMESSTEAIMKPECLLRLKPCRSRRWQRSIACCASPRPGRLHGCASDIALDALAAASARCVKSTTSTRSEQVKTSTNRWWNESHTGRQLAA